MSLFGTWGGKIISLADASFWRGFFGAQTSSGETVTYERALGLDSVWACINLLASTCSTLPCMVYRQDKMATAIDHPLYAMLHDLPNADDTAPEFWFMCIASLCLDGNFFAEKKFVGTRLSALLPFDPLKVNVTRNKSGDREYIARDDRGGERRIPADRMFHVRAFVLPGCDRGLSPIGVQRNVLGNAM